MFHKTALKKPTKRKVSQDEASVSAAKVYIMKILTDEDNEIQIQLESDGDTLSASSDQIIELHATSQEGIKTEIIEEQPELDESIEVEQNEQDLTLEDSAQSEDNTQIIYISDNSTNSEQGVLSSVFVRSTEFVTANDANELNNSLQTVTETVNDAENVSSKSTYEQKPKKRKNAFSGWIANRHKLRFQEKWFVEFPFLQYDKENNLMYCKACRRYVNDFRKTSPFVIGTNNFRESMIKYHGRSSMHAECQKLADALTSQDSEALEKDLYKDQLSHVFKSVYFIFKNKLPYSHYPQLCESQKREGADFTVYTTQFKVAPLFGKYISMGFEKELAQKISNIPEFSLVIDASFQRNIENHDLVYIKYLDRFMVQTVFLGVIDSSAKLHDTIFNMLTALFKRYGITKWINKVVYVMTDRSDTHLWLEGLMELIKSMNPQKFFSEVMYLSHKVKFCASVVQDHNITKEFDALVWSIYGFYERVDKGKKNLINMNIVLDEITEFYGGLPRNHFNALYYEALKAIKDDYPLLVRLVESEILLANLDFKIRKSGSRIASLITRGSFICKLALLIDIFSCLNNFATELSSEDILPYDVHMLLDEVCADIEKAADGDGQVTEEIAEKLSISSSYFENIEISEDCNVHQILPEVKRFSLDVILYLKSLVDESLLENSYIFNVCMWPEEELESFGSSEFADIFQKFCGKEKNLDPALAEWNIFKSKVLSSFPFEVRQNSKSIIMKMATEYINEFPIVTSILRKILLLNFEAYEIKRGYHEMCLNKSISRSVLNLQSLQTAMMVSLYGPPLNEFDFSLAMELFLNSRHRKFRKKIIDKKLTVNSTSDHEEDIE